VNIVLCALLGYFIGNINMAYIISRIKGFDIREKGTGNAGASNVMMTVGKSAGALTAVFDISKAVVSVILAVRLFPLLRSAEVISGVGCILGHIFPVAMKFHGGKGFACLSGMVLAYSPKIFLVLLLAEAVAVLVFDYICIVPVSSSVIFTIIYSLITGDPFGTLVLSFISVVILLKHTNNFRRIQNGTEVHVSFLWRKDEEVKRVRKNSGQKKDGQQ